MRCDGFHRYAIAQWSMATPALGDAVSTTSAEFGQTDKRLVGRFKVRTHHFFKMLWKHLTVTERRQEGVLLLRVGPRAREQAEQIDLGDDVVIMAGLNQNGDLTPKRQAVDPLIIEQHRKEQRVRHDTTSDQLGKARR